MNTPGTAQHRYRTWRLGPRPAADPGRRGGRGLLLVENLCLRWGVLPGLRGKTIWAELATPAALP